MTPQSYNLSEGMSLFYEYMTTKVNNRVALDNFNKWGNPVARDAIRNLYQYAASGCESFGLPDAWAMM